MLNSDWLKTKLRLIVQDLRLIVTFMQQAHNPYAYFIIKLATYDYLIS